MIHGSGKALATCCHLSRSNADLHPPGRILATSGIKLDLREHGLDIIAVYLDETIGISTGECKAYLTNPSRAISDAAKQLKQVDTHHRDGEIRVAMNQIFDSLNAEHQAAIGQAFWHDNRSLLPFICCDEAHALDWNKKRRSLGKLDVVVPRKILFPLTLIEARRVFNSISDKIRGYILTNGQVDV